MSRLQILYKENIVRKLFKKFSYKSIMEVPKIIKIVLNMGLSEAVSNKKIINYALKDLEIISGQKPIITKSKKSIAAFKIRVGYPIGCMVTLRKSKMYDFLDRLINLVLPRIKDFRGISNKSFDGRGNFNFGIKEQIIFPEISFEKIDKIRGLNISIVTNAKNDKEAKFLLLGFNFPFILK
ncbi:50S ribosomal protein L5 [Candidatus Zinderia endosymbiont of Aphrophora alni]|uniref:50S ribosomal protein L5 n=1 Tax=Candidatus Zinderia endosymbiont of Aphrophora alni TaxID=3077951 RepID=UPI0030D19A4F